MSFRPTGGSGEICLIHLADPSAASSVPARDDISDGIFADSRKKICRIKNVSYLCSPEINSGSSLKFAFGEYKADKGGEKEFTFVND